MSTSNFYRRFQALCEEHGATIRSTMLALGYSPAAATKWKKGSMPDTVTLDKIAKHFSVLRS